MKYLHATPPKMVHNPSRHRNPRLKATGIVRSRTIFREIVANVVCYNKDVSRVISILTHASDKNVR